MLSTAAFMAVVMMVIMKTISEINGILGRIFLLQVLYR
jgi:hypothetical protein